MPNAPMSHRMQVVHEEITANFRASGYAITNCFVNQQRIWMETLKMDPATLLIYMVIALAGVQKLTRQLNIPEHMKGFEPLPPELVGTISRRAVAAASGMPRETVRRIIVELLESGRLVKSGRNAVRLPSDNARTEGFMGVPSLLMVETMRMIDELQRLGVLVDREANGVCPTRNYANEVCIET